MLKTFQQLQKNHAESERSPTQTHISMSILYFLPFVNGNGKFDISLRPKSAARKTGRLNVI